MPQNAQPACAHRSERHDGNTLTAFVTADEQLVDWYEGCPTTSGRRSRSNCLFLPEPLDVAGIAGFRLSEVALHSWDVFAAFDDASVQTVSTNL